MNQEKRINEALERQIASPSISVPTNSWLYSVMKGLIDLADTTINDEIDFVIIAEQIDEEASRNLIFESPEVVERLYQQINLEAENIANNFYKTEIGKRLVNNYLHTGDTKDLYKLVFQPIQAEVAKISKQMEDRIHWRTVFLRGLTTVLIKIVYKLVEQLVYEIEELYLESNDAQKEKKLDRLFAIITEQLESSYKDKNETLYFFIQFLKSVQQLRDLDLTLVHDQTESIEDLELSAMEYNEKILELAQTKKIENQTYEDETLRITLKKLGKENHGVELSRICYGVVRINTEFAKKLNKRVAKVNGFNLRYFSAVASLNLNKIELSEKEKMIYDLTSPVNSSELNSAILRAFKTGFKFTYNSITGEIELIFALTGIKSLDVLSPQVHAYLKQRIAKAIAFNLSQSNSFYVDKIDESKDEILARIAEVVNKPAITATEESDVIHIPNDYIPYQRYSPETETNQEVPTTQESLKEVDQDILIKRIPRGITANRFHAFIEKYTGKPIRTTGKHLIYQRFDFKNEIHYGKTCAVPYHGSNQALGVGIIVCILKTLEIPREEFIDQI